MADLLSDYLALREANNLLRQGGIDRIWESLQSILVQFNQSNFNQFREPMGPTGSAEEATGQPGNHLLQIGRQDWQFTLDKSTLVGERLGLRRGSRTIVFEIGWPRLPEHGHVPGLGLARGRIGFSQNTMLDPRPIAGIILRRDPTGHSAHWFLLRQEGVTDAVVGSTGSSEEELTDSVIAGFVHLLTS